MWGHMKRDYLSSDAIERFEAKYIPEPNSGCWLWTGACCGNGYGAFWTGHSSINAHRVSYLLYKGSIPDGLLVRHTCDVPQCVNPEHLLLGTQKQNVADKFFRNRQADVSGERNPRAILSHDDVKKIRSRALGGETKRSINKSYPQVGHSTICRIVLRQIWQ